MENYDGILGFNYGDIKEWENFVKEYILPLNNTIAKLLGLRDYLEDIVSDQSLGQVLKMEANLKPMLLGGVSKDGEYKENSLAKIFRYVLGIYINPAQWVSLMGEEGIEAMDYVRCKFSTPVFLKFLREIKKLTDEIISNKEIKGDIGKEGFQNLKENSEEIVEEIKKIYEKLIKISADYNYHTFFILSTKNVPMRYLSLAYPQLRMNFDNLANFLDLKVYFTPEIKEKNIKDAYTIWTYKENGFANCIYKLNSAIWKYFNEEEIRKFFESFFSNVVNLREEYLRVVGEKLSEIGWKFPDYIKTTDKAYPEDGAYSYKYNISGPVLVSYRMDGRSRRGNWWSHEDSCAISLLKLLDDLSPGLFLKYGYFLKIENNILEVIK